MKDRIQFWLERRSAAEYAAGETTPKALNPIVWGQKVLPCVLEALYVSDGSGRRCKRHQEFRYFLRPDVVYNALRWVLEYSVLPADGRHPRIACFKVLRESIREYSNAMSVYKQDWLQLALRAVQYALTELFPAETP
jgi:hypothetical protein